MAQSFHSKNFKRKNQSQFSDKKTKKQPGKRPLKPFKKTITVVQAHEKFKGVFVLRGKEDSLMTKNLTPGHSVYKEKRVSVEEDNKRVEYRAWNPFRSKLCAGIMSGCDYIFMKPGSKVLYLGAASGTTVSHVSDLIGEEGTVYAVEFSQRSGRELVNLAKRRRNIVPIIEDARQPSRYRMLVPMVDCIFSDVAQPDQVRIVGLNAKYFLKNKGGVMISIKANCVDSTVAPDVVFSREVNNLKNEGIKPKEQVPMEPYEKDHAMLIGVFKS